MTLIECFTESHVDNIAACLRLHPEKMILVGSREKMAAPAQRYRKLLSQRGMKTALVLCDVRGKDFPEICGALETLIRAEKDCVIDLTGGDETVIMAVGAVLNGEHGHTVRVEKLDYGTGLVHDCINDNRVLPYAPVRLTVEELITLHGGSIRTGESEIPENAAAGELAGIWSVVAGAPKEWNRAISYLGEFEKRADSKMQVYLYLPFVRDEIRNSDVKEEIVRDFLGKLHGCGAVRDQSSRNSLEYTYSSPLLRHCTRKAGNLLEAKTLLEGREVRTDGKPFFHDCRMSVTIDWDGREHTAEEGIPDTRNEIDIILMHGMTPLFISCKNGDIGEEELYKLHTVAQRFGGPNAKKMLIATDLDRKSIAANRAFVQRAWDMDIFLETDAAELSPDAWQELFLRAIQ